MTDREVEIMNILESAAPRWIESLIEMVEQQKIEIKHYKQYASFLNSVARSGEQWEGTINDFLSGIRSDIKEGGIT